jgi:hypothetical protein
MIHTITTKDLLLQIVSSAIAAAAAAGAALRAARLQFRLLSVHTRPLYTLALD